MSLPFVLTEDSVLDLEQAVAHIALDSPQSALKLADELEQTFLFLGQWPSAGHTREDLSLEPDLRFWTSRGYLIAYLHSQSPIVIVCALHGSRDVAAILVTRLGHS